MGSIADRMAGMASGGGARLSHHMGGKPPMEEHEGMDGGEHSELHAHGDGTYHTMAGGKKTEHPSFGHAVMHMAAHHHPDEMHSHVHHHEDGGHTSHHMKDGAVSGPHDHENMDALKSHMDKFLDEEKNESSDYGDGGGSPFGEGE